jgi:4,5-dihydroxyphthalate decarboxylase
VVPELRTAFWSYDRTLPLIDGSVQVEECTLAIEVLRPESIFSRAFSNAEFDLCELSLSNAITAFSKCEFPYVLIPAFLARTFRHSSIIVRVDRGIRQPQDLRGKTVGLQEYGMTAAVVIRGFLRDYGVEPRDICWQVGEKGISKPPEFPTGRPPDGVNIKQLSSEISLEDRLQAGELDAAFLVRSPASLRAPWSKIAFLFPDAKAAEKEWYAAKKIFPIMHAVGIRRSLLRDDPTLSRRIFDAFRTAKDMAVSELEVTQAPKVTLPWSPAAVSEARALMGQDFWPYGIRANRHVLEAQIRWSALDGLQARPVTIEEMFAEDCLDT